MSNTPFISVSLDSRLIEKKKFDQDSISIGRDIENDIHINNLAVSRFHAKILKEGSKYMIKDLGSANGTFVNGFKVDWSEVRIGDAILIGKHFLVLEPPKQLQDEAFTEGHTVMVDQNTQDKFLKKLESKAPAQQTNHQTKIIILGGVEVPLESDYFTIGKDQDCDIKISDMFIKNKHASIVKQANGSYRIINSGSFFKPTKVNGSKVDEKILNNGDVIQIGRQKMVFVL